MVFRNQKGNIAFAAIVGICFVGLFGAIYMVFFAGMEGKGRKPASDPRDDFEVLRARVEAALNDSAINASVQRNPNAFFCLSTTEAVCADKGGTFLLYESMEQTVHPLSQLVKDAGLGPDGLGCKNFPSELCPFHVETEWKPICAPGGCTNTKSMNVVAKVIYHLGEGKAQPLQWSKEAMFTPQIRVSPQTQCEREGRVWDQGNCINPDVAAQRSGQKNDPGGISRPSAPDSLGPAGVPMVQPQQEVEFVCPTSIVVQGLQYTVEMTHVNRAQVRIPAINGCPAEDTFIFQCTAKNPPSFEGEGQWVQVEAAMAPACDQQGNPINPSLRQ